MSFKPPTPPRPTRAGRKLLTFIGDEGAEAVAEACSCSALTIMKIAAGVSWPPFWVALVLYTGYGIELADWVVPAGVEEEEGGDE